jgi:hypothetical protein
LFHVARKEVVGLLAGRHALLGSGDIGQLAHVADDLGLRDVRSRLAAASSPVSPVPPRRSA